MTIGELKAAIQATGLPDDAQISVEGDFEAFDITSVELMQRGCSKLLFIGINQGYDDDDQGDECDDDQE